MKNTPSIWLGPTPGLLQFYDVDWETSDPDHARKDMQDSRVDDAVLYSAVVSILCPEG